MKAILLLVVALAVGQGVNWAFIVAGSNGYGNYRHQADVSHAYQMLRTHGFPEDHIIQMQYDDIAQSSQNPFKGNIINKPGGPNVYPGTEKIDYKGNTCTAANFLKILKGDKAGMAGIGSGKVIESGPEDNIFVFYSDHGAPGLVAMPVGGYLYATDLNKVIKDMAAAKKFNKMTLYIEACESGSMFDKLLPENINVYATTASNPTESSWACYYDSSRNAYLGDTYSVNFLEHADIAEMSKDTLQDQFVIIKQKTTESHVMQYGDLKIAKEKLENFEAYQKFDAESSAPRTYVGEQVAARDVHLATMLHMLETASDAQREQLVAEIDAEMALRAKTDRQFNALVMKVSGNTAHLGKATSVNDAYALKFAVKAVESFCGHMGNNDYTMGHIHKIANLVNAGYTPSQLYEAARSVCA